MDAVTHPFEPVYDENSRILILGSFPSVKSRENHFYYGHPQNRFWKVAAGVTGSSVPQTVEEKRAFLLAHGIAVWDSIASCRIEGSSDSSIRDAVPTTSQGFWKRRTSKRCSATGQNRGKPTINNCEKACGQKAGKLPSTSPANAAWSVERLIKEWKKELGAYLDSPFQICPMTPEDYEQVHALWMTIHGFSIRTIDDSREGVERFLKRNPGISVTAKADGR